ncbi:MAG: hypothetical protein IJL17_08505 [Kiritimatiellae bacterium]|nr:hypothetical protein [Kiritimatiellia bacterium]
MNARKTIGLVWAVAIAVVAQGAEVESVKSATGQGVSIFDPATWGISGVLSSADDYILKHNGISVSPSRYMDATTKVATFPGNSLHLRASFQPDSRGYVLEFPRAGLFFDQNGIFRTWDTSTTPGTIGVTGTAITVTSPDSAPAKIMSTAAPPGVMTCDFCAPLNGAAGTRLQVQRYSNSTYPGTMTLRLLNACTNFFGTIRLEGNKSTLVLGTPEFPGTVRLCYTTAGGTSTLTALDGVNASVKAVIGENAPVTIAVPQADSFEIGDLTLAGGTISFAAVGSGTNTHAAVLAVTNSLALSSPVTIAYPAGAAAFRAAPLDDLAAAVTVLTLPVGKGTLSASDFTLAIEAQPDVCGALPHSPYLAVRTVDGLQRLVVAYDQPVVVQTFPDYSNNGGSSFLEANKGRWSDGQLPGPGKHYFVPANVQLMTVNNVPFTGESLTVRGTLAICAQRFTVTAISFVGGAVIYEYSSNPVLDGPVTTYGTDAVRVRPSPGNTLTFTGELSGTAPFRLLYYEANGVGRNTGVRFSHDNTPYAGKFEFGVANTSGLSSDYADGNTSVKLQVADQRELGGPLPAFAYDAITLNSRMGVAAVDSLVFDEPTRGLYVYGAGRVDVPAGKQLAFAQPITWRGSLMKYGAGTLAFGGVSAPRFYYQSAIHDTPMTTADKIMRTTVLEGGVKALTTNALDGCELEICSGASLVLDAAPTNADLRAYGFVNAKWGTPFVLPEGMTTVPVTFDFGGGEPDFAVRTLGICTVRSDATGVSNALFAPVPPSRYGARVLSAVDAATGLTTYSVQIARSGLTIIFK